MTDFKSISDETPEADAIDQHHLVLDVDHHTGLDTTYLDAVGDREANQVDVIDQAIVVPAPEHDTWWA